MILSQYATYTINLFLVKNDQFLKDNHGLRNLARTQRGLRDERWKF